MKTTSAKAILIAASLLFPLCCFAQTKSKEAAAYANSGIVKLKRHDFDGAIADFNRALQLDPKVAKVYESRGLAKREKYDLDGAIADFNRALQLDPRYAHAYYSRGNAKREKYELIASGGVGVFSPDDKVTAKERAELQSAIADFNRALQFDPTNAKAYDNRGIVKMVTGDFDGAIVDFNRALELDPRLALVYEARGVAKEVKSDLDGAIADYSRALELNPKLDEAYLNRGEARIHKGDTEPGIADVNRALELSPKLSLAYRTRGNARFITHNWTDALQDYRRFCELSQHYQEYPRLATWIVRSRLGEREAADKELATYFTAAPGTWPSKIQAYLLGNLSEPEFLAAAASPDAKTDRRYHCEAWFYAGMKNLIDSNKPVAAEFFKKCLATEQKNVTEYHVAKAELKTLGQ